MYPIGTCHWLSNTIEAVHVLKFVYISLATTSKHTFEVFAICVITFLMSQSNTKLFFAFVKKHPAIEGTQTGDQKHRSPSP